MVASGPGRAADDDAVGRARGPAGEPLKAQEWRGMFDGPDKGFTAVVRGRKDWEQLWARVSQKPPVALDPSRDMAVGIFLGNRPTGGYAVEILSTKKARGGKRQAAEYEPKGKREEGIEPRPNGGHRLPSHFPGQKAPLYS